MGLLNYDGPFMTGLRKLVNYVFLGILWVVASIPIITFGASTTAMLFTAENSVRKDQPKMLSTFWNCFRNEFKQATILWLMAIVLIAPLALNAFLLWRMEMPNVIFAVLFITVLFGFCWIQLWFGYLATFEDTVRTILGNTFRMTLMNFPWAVLMLGLVVVSIVGAIFAFFFAAPVLFLIPGIYGMLASRIIRRIFKNFLPDEDNPEMIVE